MSDEAGGFRQPGAPASQQGMRRANLALVLGAIAGLGTTSRAQIAEATGLTRAAVGNLVGQLAAAGLIREHGTALEGRVGRPSTVLSLNDHGPAGLGLEIGVGHLGACVVDLHGTVRTRIEVQAANRGRDPRLLIGQLAELADQATRQAADLGLRPVGTTVAVPGIVHAAGAPDPAGPGLPDTVVHAPNLAWHQVPLVDLLRERLPERLRGCPLGIENEANLGALAELWHGNAGRDFIHVSAEAGIGAALVVDGQIRRGARGYAGELGHVPVFPDWPPCSCGARGCLEQYAGDRAVLLAAGLGEPAGDRVEALVGAATAGQGAVREALDQAGRALGIALAGAVNLTDPARVVLGGAYGELAAWLTPGMHDELAARVKIRPWEPEALIVSGLGRTGPVLGAASTTIQRLIGDPSSL